MLAKQIISGLLCFICSNALYADYDAAKLQKLFTDKQQRVQIDAARSGKNIDPELQKTDKISVSGYVTRTDGKSVAWVNNKNTLDSSKMGDVRVSQVKIGINKKVTVSVDGQIKSLKPGESWQKESGEIVESYK